MKKYLFLSLILIFCAPASAQQVKRNFKDFVKEPAFYVYVGGSVADITASAKRVDGISITEANPLWRTSDGKFSVPKNLLVSAAHGYIVYEVYRRSRWAGVGAMLGVGVLRGALCYHTMNLKGANFEKY